MLLIGDSCDKNIFHYGGFSKRRVHSEMEIARNQSLQSFTIYLTTGSKQYKQFTILNRTGTAAVNNYLKRVCRTQKSSRPALHQTHYPGCKNEDRGRNQVRSLLCSYPCTIARVCIELILRKHRFVLLPRPK